MALVWWEFWGSQNRLVSWLGAVTLLFQSLPRVHGPERGILTASCGGASAKIARRGYSIAAPATAAAAAGPRLIYVRGYQRLQGTEILPV